MRRAGSRGRAVASPKVLALTQMLVYTALPLAHDLLRAFPRPPPLLPVTLLPQPWSGGVAAFMAESMRGCSTAASCEHAEEALTSAWKGDRQ